MCIRDSYYDELRAAGRELPDLYVAPPSPVGKFYRELLGQDVHLSLIHI